MLLRILINFYELIMELLFKFFCECVFWVCMNFMYIFFVVIVIVEFISGKVKLEKIIIRINFKNVFEYI